MSVLPIELDFLKNRAASPARMNLAMQYIVARLRGVEALRAEIVTATNALQQVGLARLDETLTPLIADAQASFDQIAALLAAWQSGEQTQALFDQLDATITEATATLGANIAAQNAAVVAALADQAAAFDGLVAKDSLATAVQAAAGEANDVWMSALRTKQAIDALSSRIQIDTFTASGTWNKPASGTLAIIEVWGGGAGGGGGYRQSASYGYGGYGGGGGAYRKAIIPLVDLAASVSVTIGAGGTGGAGATVDNGTPASGGMGGSTSFGSYISANGGGQTGSAQLGGSAAPDNSNRTSSSGGFADPIGGGASYFGFWGGGFGGSYVFNVSPNLPFGSTFGGGGGGGGGSVTGLRYAGSAGSTGMLGPLNSGAAAGTAGSPNGSAGQKPGAGGGGGYPGDAGGTIAGGNGGAGGIAGGGGGGGGAINGANGGNGGAGGPGLCRVTVM